MSIVHNVISIQGDNLFIQNKTQAHTHTNSETRKQ